MRFRPKPVVHKSKGATRVTGKTPQTQARQNAEAEAKRIAKQQKRK